MIYNARTDLAIAPTPTPPPPMPQKNTIITDPDFGTQILRATDGTTLHNASLSVGSAGACQVFNCNCTLFWINTVGGGNVVVQFDPIGMQVAKTLVVPPGGLCWSHKFPNVLYTVSKGILLEYTLAPDLSGFTSQTLYNFNTIAPPVVTWESIFTVSEDDNQFGLGFSNTGGQGTGNIAAIWIRDRGVRVLTSSTGEVTGDFGVTGAINLPDRFLLHEVSMSKMGDYLILGKSPNSTIAGDPLGSVYFWNVLTLGVQYVGGKGGGGSGGHPAQGWKLWFNPSPSPIGSANLRPYSDVSQFITVCKNVPNPLQKPLDSHCSWHNGDMLDTLPFCQITTNAPSTLPYISAWVNEGLLYDPVAQVVYRQMHTFASGQSRYFGAQQGIGTISPNGQFIIWASDWLETLGLDQAGVNRSDVFICKCR